MTLQGGEKNGLETMTATAIEESTRLPTATTVADSTMTQSGAIADNAVHARAGVINSLPAWAPRRRPCWEPDLYMRWG